MSQQVAQIVENIFPKRRQNLLKESGWGYRDVYLYFNKDKNALLLHGKRYPGIGTKPLGRALDGLKNIFHIDISEYNPNKHIPPSVDDYPMIENSEFCKILSHHKIEFSTSFDDRFYRGHSQSSMDIHTALYGKFKKIPDMVVWPKNHEEVVKIVEFSNKFNVGLIPFGGGSNVTNATECPATENRTICSLDTTQMCRMMWINEKSKLACFETGISGQDLEKVLRSKGFTMGHEPDSIEFSTLGGWIITKSAGLKQQAYGNIEDIVVKMKIVTSIGVLDYDQTTPRSSTGPDIERLLIGSEGTLGVITEAVVRIHPIPKSIKYASFIFADFSHGIKFLYDCSQNDWLPSNIRLFCNKNVLTGMELEETDTFNNIFHHVRKFFIKNALRFDDNKFTVAAYMIEGDEASVKRRDKHLRALARSYGGFNVGENTAKHGYLFSSTYSIYLRDLLFNVGTLADTIETSVIWSKLEQCIENLVNGYNDELKRLGVQGFILYRISQIYKEGVCLYTYYGITKCDDQVNIFRKLTDFVKSSNLKSGGSLSHHHGIGAKNTSRYNTNMPAVKKEMLRSIKQHVDPKNIFCVKNFFADENFDNKIIAKL